MLLDVTSFHAFFSGQISILVGLVATTDLYGVSYGALSGFAGGASMQP